MFLPKTHMDSECPVTVNFSFSLNMDNILLEEGAPSGGTSITGMWFDHRLVPLGNQKAPLTTGIVEPEPGLNQKARFWPLLLGHFMHKHT